MSIILENIKNRNNIYNKKQYRYMDYNDLAIGQVGILLIDYLNEKVNSGEIQLTQKDKILKTLDINEKNIKINDINLFKECLVSIEYDKIKYNNKTIYPKYELEYVFKIAEKLKDFYSKKEDKHIYPDILAKEIFSLYEITTLSIDDLLNFETYREENESVLFLINGFVEKLEKDLIYTTINSESPRYDLNSIIIDKKKYNLNMRDLKQLAPILINGNSIVWDKLEDSGLASSKLNLKSIDIDKTIRMLAGIDYGDLESKSITLQTYQYVNDKIDLDSKINNIDNLFSLNNNSEISEIVSTLKIYLMKSILEVDSLGELLLNNNNLNTYKKNILTELNKINRFKESDSKDLFTNLKKIYNNINGIMASFRNENSAINIDINDKNKNKVYGFESNYYQVKTILQSYAKKGGLSLLLPGPPDFGKSHSSDEFVELFGGLVIKQEHIMSLSALVGTFEKRPANFDPNKRTHPLTELKTSVINGEYGNGIIHMEEGARTFMELLNNKVNSPDESALLSILEPMSRSNKYWKVDAYGKEIKLYPSEHIKFVWSTNFIPKHMSTGIQVRFTSIPMDFSTITNYNSLSNIINNMMYKMNVEREISNFSDENNSLKYINNIQGIYSKIKDIIDEFKLDDLYNMYKDSSSYEEYNKKLDKDMKRSINNFMVDNRINPYIVFKSKDIIENIFNDIKEYSKPLKGEPIDILNKSMKYIRVKKAIEELNKEYDLSLDPIECIEKCGLSIDTIVKSLEDKNININDVLQRYHTIDIYFMSVINQFKFLDNLKLELLETKSIVNNDFEIISTVGKYIKDDIDMKYISGNENESEIVIYDKIKENYLKLVSKYNRVISDDYKTIVKSYENKYSITPFKSTDAPIIGFEKILKSINGLSKSKGFIDEDLLKTMTVGTDLPKFKSVLEEYDTFVSIEVDDIGLGGL